MPRRRETAPLETTSRRPPATTPEARENQMISLAMDLAEKRIREGTASAQEVSHFLKLGSSRERLEQERLAHENALTQAKIEQIAAAERTEELYRKALGAMSKYQGRPTDEFDDDLED